MPNTYTQLYIQLVFAVRFREALVNESLREPLQKYLTGIATQHGHKMLAVYCMPDHTHVFVGLNPVQSISQLANALKANSSRWINSENFCRVRFQWQQGYGAFSYHKELIPVVARYIINQKEHHRQRSFRKEYLEFLKEFDIAFDDQYLFDFFE